MKKTYALLIQIFAITVLSIFLTCSSFAEKKEISARTLFWECESILKNTAQHGEASRGKAGVLQDTMVIEFKSAKQETYILWVRTYLDAKGTGVPVEIKTSDNATVKPAVLFQSNSIAEEYEKKKKKAMEEFLSSQGEAEEKDEFGEMMGIEEEKVEKEPPKYEEHKGVAGYYWDSAVLSVTQGTVSITFKNATKVSNKNPFIDVVFATTRLDYSPFYLDFQNYGDMHVRILCPPGEGLFGVNIGGAMHHDPWGFGGELMKSSSLEGLKKWFPAGKPSPWLRLADLEKFPYYDFTLRVRVVEGKDYELDDETGVFRIEFANAPNPEYIYRKFDMDGMAGAYVKFYSPNEIFLPAEVAWWHYEWTQELSGDTYLVPISRITHLISGSIPADKTSHPIECRALRMIGINTSGPSQNLTWDRMLGCDRYHLALYSPEVMQFGSDDDTVIQKQALESWGRYINPLPEEIKRKTVHYNVADEPGAHLPISILCGSKWEVADSCAVEYTGNGKLYSKRRDFKDYIFQAEYLCRDSFTLGLFVRDDTGGKNAKKYDEPRPLMIWNFHLPSNNDPLRSWSYVEGLGMRDVMPIVVVPSFGVWHKIAVVTHGQDMKMYLDGKLCKVYTLKQPVPEGGFQFEGKGLLKVKNVKIYKSESIDDEPWVADNLEKKLAEQTEEEEPEDLDMAVAAGNLKDRLIYEDKLDRTLDGWELYMGNKRYISHLREDMKKEGYEPKDFGKETWDDVTGIPEITMTKDIGDSFTYYRTKKYWLKTNSLYYKYSTDAIERHFGRKVPTSVNFTDHGSFFFSNGMTPGGVDWMSFGRERGVTSPGTEDWMSFGGWRWGSMLAVAYLVDILRGGSSHHENWTSFHTVWSDRERLMSLLGHRENFIIFWVFGPHYAFTEGMWSESYGTYSGILTAAKLLSKLDVSAKDAVYTKPKVGFLYSITSELWNDYYVFWDKLYLYLMIHHGQHPVRILAEEDLTTQGLSYYKALVVADRYFESRRVPALEKWVNDGGTLLAGYDCGRYDERNTEMNFLEKFGVRVTGHDTNGSKAMGVKGTFMENDTFVLTNERMLFECDRPYETIAVYPDGKSAIIKIKFNKGAVFVYAFKIGSSHYASAFFHAGFRDKWIYTGVYKSVIQAIRSIVPPIVEEVPPALEADVWDYENGNVIIFNEWISRGNVNTGFKFRTDYEVKEVESGMLGKLAFTCKKKGNEYVTEVNDIKISECDMISMRKKPRTAPILEEEIPSPSDTDVLCKELELWYAGYGKGQGTTKDIADGLKNEHEWIRVWALDAGGRLRLKDLAKEYERLCKDESQWVRMRAIWALSRVDRDSAHKLAREMIYDEWELTRKYAVLALDTGNTETIDILLSCLTDTDGRVVSSAITKLFQCGYKPEWNTVRKWLEKGGLIQSSATAFLPELWSKEADKVTEYITNERKDMTNIMISGLYNRRDGLAEDIMKQFLIDGTRDMKYWVAYYLPFLWRDKPEKNTENNPDIKLLIDCYGIDRALDLRLTDSLHAITGILKYKWK